MIETDPLPTLDPDLAQSDFIRELARQTRALDSYGSCDGWPIERVLAPYVVTKAQRREMPVIGDPDDILIARVRAFHNAIAVLIENECGRMAAPLIHLSHEGFGRALITVGKLVVTDRTLRDVHRFGFDSYSKMKDEADRHLAVALGLVGKYPDVAGL